MIDPEFIKQWIIAKLKSRDIVIWLVAINLCLYLIGFVVNLVGLPFGIKALANNFIYNWLALPSDFSVYIFKFYTILTYQFFHTKFFHLLSNVILLFYFGSQFIKLTHKKKLLPLYIYGGLFSGLVFLLVYNLNPILNITTSAPIIGASGAVMAVLAAVCTLIPDSDIYLFGRFRIKYKWIAIFFVAINILGINSPNAAESFVHLGGLLFGFLFVTMSRNGVDIVTPFNQTFDYFLSFFDFSNKPKVTYINEKFKDKKVYQASTKENNNDKQAKIDAILDKISAHGYDKLSKAEKDYLFKNSNK